MLRRSTDALLGFGPADDFDDADAEVFIHDDDFATGDEPVVDHDVDGLTGEAVEFNDRARAEAEDIGDGEFGAAEFDGDVHLQAGEEVDAAAAWVGSGSGRGVKRGTLGGGSLCHGCGFARGGPGRRVELLAATGAGVGGAREDRLGEDLLFDEFREFQVFGR